MGHTWEHRPHYYLRRVLLDRITLGDESVHLPRIAAMPMGEAHSFADEG
jgi:hypothetical protein